MSSKDMNIAWHPGFVNAMKLELIEDEDCLTFDEERLLNQEPIRLDLLIIKKNKSKVLKNEIADYFKGHNIIEFKSEKDDLNIDTVYKLIAYSALYKAYASKVDEIKADDITMMAVRTSKPLKLFKYFEEHGMIIKNERCGIYLIEDGFEFPLQIVVSKELDKDNHLWLFSLRANLSREDIKRFAVSVGRLQNKKEKMYSDSVMSAVTRANDEEIEKLKKEDPDMCKELWDIMKPEIDAAMDAKIDANKREIAENLLKLGNNTDSQIAKCTGLTLKQVKEIKSNILVSK